LRTLSHWLGLPQWHGATCSGRKRLPSYSRDMPSLSRDMPSLLGLYTLGEGMTRANHRFSRVESLAARAACALFASRGLRRGEPVFGLGKKKPLARRVSPGAQRVKRVKAASAGLLCNTARSATSRLAYGVPRSHLLLTQVGLCPAMPSALSRASWRLAPSACRTSSPSYSPAGDNQAYT
jgi:hypothetical protein